jgi:hypothetical protein
VGVKVLVISDTIKNMDMYLVQLDGCERYPCPVFVRKIELVDIYVNIKKHFNFRFW